MASDDKWEDVFDHVRSIFGLIDNKKPDYQKVWAAVAVAISSLTQQEMERSVVFDEINFRFIQYLFPETGSLLNFVSVDRFLLYTPLTSHWTLSVQKNKKKFTDLQITCRVYRR